MLNLFVYGTLRPGGRLNPYYELEMVQSEVELLGFSMIDSGCNYPIAFKDEDSTIIGDVMRTDRDEFNRIKAMEEGAGYSTVRVNIDGVEDEVHMFIQKLNTETSKEDKIVNWLDYVGAQNAERV